MSAVHNAIKTFKNNQFLIVMDDATREDEGDLIIAAEGITTEQMAFMVQHGSGFVCTPMSNAIADKLDFPLITDFMKCESAGGDRHGTNYTISCDVENGTTTGISAYDRAMTCRRLASNRAKATDFYKPGHIVPLRAVDGGLRKRDGHTEAAVTLCKLANMPEVAVISELVIPNGNMMRADGCVVFSKKYGIPMITIKDLTEYATKHGY